MEINIILLSILSVFAVVLSILSYISLQKLRSDVKTAQKEMIDLRNHVNLSIKELSNKTSVSCSDEKKGFSTDMSVGEVLALHPAAKNILTMFHLGACSSCSVTDDHNFGEAIKEYDIDQKAILNALNDLLEGSNPAFS
ncbi:MAG: hypothetical protein VYD66_03830 [Candidatus Neomarinimicrobiota bacterium]|nr:hypothetical protein [Candidatus Neomarinimicrobiota bacterium]